MAGASSSRASSAWTISMRCSPTSPRSPGASIAQAHAHNLATGQTSIQLQGVAGRKALVVFLSAQRAAQRVLVRTGPARHEHADHRHARHGHHEEDADVEVEREQRVTEGQHDEDRDVGHHRHRRPRTGPTGPPGSSSTSKAARRSSCDTRRQSTCGESARSTLSATAGGSSGPCGSRSPPHRRGRPSRTSRGSPCIRCHTPRSTPAARSATCRRSARRSAGCSRSATTAGRRPQP